jgi:hypothetical protein
MFVRAQIVQHDNVARLQVRAGTTRLHEHQHGTGSPRSRANCSTCVSTSLRHTAYEVPPPGAVAPGFPA